MTTLDDLRYHLELDYLEPITDRPAMAPITNSLMAGATSITFDAGVFSPDEESLIGPGSEVEVDYELFLCTAYDGSTRTLTVQPGHRNTTEEAHAAGAHLRLPGRFTRSAMERALRHAVAGLWEPLWVRKQIRTAVDVAGYLPLPSNSIKAIEVAWLDTDDRWYPAPAHLTESLDPNVKALQVHAGTPAGRLAVVDYGVEIQVPTSRTDDIEDLPQKWERIVLVDAALQLTSGVDIDAVSQDFVVEALRLQGFPVRSGATITTALIQVREYLMKRARDAMTADQDDLVERRDTVYLG